ncbi:hypothetical protein [Jatrophihabitans sp.]|uniref:hypothetical protein n=1 Tax=Jatrophihabitans sp. TaxID=1932789 RepID=UPI0030C66EFB
MRKYPAENWEWLGQWIHDARVVAGYSDTKKWAAAVGRSPRQLLGLERGEQVGTGTIEAVAKALDLPASDLYWILANSDEPRVAFQVKVRSDSPDAQQVDTGDRFPGPVRLLLMDGDGNPVSPADQVAYAEAVRRLIVEQPGYLHDLLVMAAEAVGMVASKGGDGDAEDDSDRGSAPTTEPPLTAEDLADIERLRKAAGLEDDASDDDQGELHA